MASRYIIGRGELLTYTIPPPPHVPTKKHPYTLDEAKAALLPQLRATAKELDALPDAACPRGLAVAKLTLHPAYIAKSYFPANLLRSAGLDSVGSRTVRLKPRKDVRAAPPEQSETMELFVAGPREAFREFAAKAAAYGDGTPLGLEFAELERFSAMSPQDRVRPMSGRGPKVFEVGLHLPPELAADQVRAAFRAFAAQCGFEVHTEHEFSAGRLMFVPVRGPTNAVQKLAQFSLMRVVRPMPALRTFRPVMRSGSKIELPFDLPTGEPLSREPKVAILDGGLPDHHVLAPFVRRYRKSDEAADDAVDGVEHGLGVTSALLLGPVEPGKLASRPYSYVDHFRVVDALTDEEDPFELYRTLGHVEEVLLSRQYEYINLSLGPDLPVEDTDVHAWTAVIDELLSSGQALMTVAVGNNGERDRDLRLDRIQVPSDAVNALSVGAANLRDSGWDRAPYSARGPGRSPGRKKPDVVSYGGSPSQYFHVAAPGKRRDLDPVLGTSFAAPLALRSAVGVRAVLGDEVHPLTVKALLVHACELPEELNGDDVGWGRVPEDLNEIVTCPNATARIIFQGMLKPGKFLRAPVPLPLATIPGKVYLGATFCYASPVDPQDAAAYTKAGLSITFRPHEDKKEANAKYAKPRTFFEKKEFRTEAEQRSDLGKWETVLHAQHGLLGTSLKGATFDVHYNAREGGGTSTGASPLIRYALVLTVHAPKAVNLYDDILQAHSKLKAIEPQVSVPVRV